MKLPKQKLNQINKNVEEIAQELTLEEQKKYKPKAIEINTKLNEGFEEIIASYKKDAAPYVVLNSPESPRKNYETLGLSVIAVRETLQCILTALEPIHNNTLKVLMLDTIKKALTVIQTASVAQNTLMQEVLFSKKDN